MANEKSLDKVKKSPPKKRGRPSKYKPEYCDFVIECGKKGMSFTEIACELDVTRETLHQWTDLHPDFTDAFKKSKSYAEKYWAAVGAEKMFTANDKDDGFHPGMWMFWMKARFGWSDREQTVINQNITQQQATNVEQNNELNIIADKTIDVEAELEREVKEADPFLREKNSADV